MKNCPECDSDYLTLDSSWEQQCSAIECGDCGFRFQKPLPEDEIQVLWDELPRTSLTN